MRSANLFRAALVLQLAFAMSSCGGNTSGPQPLRSGNVLLLGTDAPLASVLAFQVTMTGLTASDGTTTVNLISGPQTIEFSQLNGLKTLLDVNAVPAGSYTSATITLASPVISFLDTSTPPPAVRTMNGTLTQSSFTVRSSRPLTVTEGENIALLLDFQLVRSLEVDANGQFTGVVDPHISVHVLRPDEPDATIDHLRGGVVSVDLTAGSFILQGPRGRQFTVLTNSQTQFSAGASLSTLNSNTIVRVAGNFDRTSLTIHAVAVDVLSQDRFGMVGLVTDARPSPGPANQLDLLVRAAVPALPNVSVGQIFTVNLTGNEKYVVSRRQMLPGSFTFGASSLVAGQQVAIGGTLDTTNTPPGLTPKGVLLEEEGFVGDWVPGSTNTGAGTFSFSVRGVAGVLFGQPVTVLTTPATRFFGLPGVSALTGTQPIQLRIVGLVLLDPNSGRPVILAQWIAIYPSPRIP